MAKRDEAALMEEAKDLVVEEEVVLDAKKRAGHPLPEQIENPKIGTIGHYCLDPDGNFQPTWMQLMIHRTDDSVPTRQFFAYNSTKGESKTWYVSTGAWVDVPPELVGVLNDAVVEVIEMNVDKANPSLDPSVEKIVKKVPRFSYNLLPSAQ